MAPLALSGGQALFAADKRGAGTMARIEVWQHVYLRLGREQSPNGFEGHQMLCYTQPGLSAVAAREIEKHLLSFPVESAPGAKQACFVLPDGRPVASNMVRLPEPDRYGRVCYLAHTAVVPRAVFDSAGMDPFGLFNAIPFLASVREAVACLNRHGEHPTGRAGNACPAPPVMA